MDEEKKKPEFDYLADTFGISASKVRERVDELKAKGVTAENAFDFIDVKGAD